MRPSDFKESACYALSAFPKSALKAVNSWPTVTVDLGGKTFEGNKGKKKLKKHFREAQKNARTADNRRA